MIYKIVKWLFMKYINKKILVTMAPHPLMHSMVFTLTFDGKILCEKAIGLNSILDTKRGK